MSPLIALAARIVPGLLKTIASDPGGNVQSAVENAMASALGAATPKVAEDKLRGDPQLQSQLENDSDLQIALATIALDQEKARISAETERQRQQQETSLARQRQSDEAVQKQAELDAQSQADARDQLAALVAADSKVAWVSSWISMIVTFGFFGIMVLFIVLKNQLESPASIPTNLPDNLKDLTDAQIAALVRPSDFVTQIINILVGALAAGFATVLSFWLGSSQGSRVKDRQIAVTNTTAMKSAESATTTAIKSAGTAVASAEQGRATAEKQLDRMAIQIGKSDRSVPDASVLAPAEDVAAGAQPPSALSSTALDATMGALAAPHRHFPTGVSWALTAQGVSVDGAPPMRTQGSPSTVRNIWQRFSRPCTETAQALGLPVELIVATIATESGGDPNARRPEPSIRDESVGLMQTLVGTAREATANPSLTAAALLDPDTSIKAGAAYIAQQRRSTHLDPPLVAAAYNAGSLRLDDAPGNRWKLHCFPKGTGRHVDNFVAFFGDAMAVSAEDNWSQGGRVPSYAHILGGGSAGATGGGGATTAERAGPVFPAPPDFEPVVRKEEKDKLFGKFEFRPKPLRGNRENIEILGDWEKENIVTVTLPAGSRLSRNGIVTTRFHKAGAAQLKSLWEEWQEDGLLDRILTFDGAFVPRFQRNSSTTLSNHSWGTAFDINAAQNPLGAEPARPGQPGCVYELVPAALRNGFYWGGHFSRKDGMHFELAKIL